MNWFIIKIVYEIICGDGEHCAQFDEQLRLVAAEDNYDAYLQGTAIGKQEALNFYNEKAQLVQWKFLAVPEIYPIQEYAHGAEIFSRIREVDHVQQYRETQLHRAGCLAQNQLTCQPYHFLT